MEITEFAFVCYPVTNLAAARAFYEGKLGLKPSNVWGDENQAFIEYEIGPHCLAITNFSPGSNPDSVGPAVALEVKDFDATIAGLKAANVRFHMEPTDCQPCSFAVICDPDGNKLFIHRRKG